MTVLRKSTLTFFTLFVAGSIVADLVRHQSLDVDGIASSLVVGAIAAALFGAFASSDARTRRD